MPKDYVEARTKDFLFVRNNYRKSLYIAMLLVVMNLLLIGWVYYTSLSTKIPPNFATTSDGRVIKVNEIK